MQFVWSAFLIGLLSSFHCVGMCGPIALSLPNSGAFGSFLYNFGRVITYSFLGVLVGIFGRLFFYSGVQQWISIVLGALIIIGFSLSSLKIQIVNKLIGIEWFSSKLKKFFSYFFSKRGVWKFLFIGVVNGFLPCGFVYLAAGNALVLANELQDSALYMFAFGLGTIPLMFILVVSKSFISLRLRSLITKVIPFFAIAMGVLLILRGLELNIPYISPLIDFSTSGEVDVECH